jgi:hypothetical protein
VNITLIKSIVDKDFLRGNRFKVTIPGAPQIVNERCCSVSWPGASYGTFAWRNAGPAIKIPYETIFDEVRLEYYCDAQGVVPKWLRKWNKDVTASDFRFNFFDEYVKDVKIEEINTSGQTVLAGNLINAYASSVEAVQLSFENQSQIEKIAIMVSYERYEDGG